MGATVVSGDETLVRAALCERRNEDKRSYKIVMDVAGDAADYAIAPGRLMQVAHELSGRLKESAPPDYLIGLAPGGIPIATALAIETGLPLVVAYKCRLGLAEEIRWEEPHCVNSTFYLYGISAGMNVVLVDDEVDSGDTLANAVLALNAADVSVLGVLSAVETMHRGASAGRSALEALGVPFHAARQMSGDVSAV